MVIVLVVELFLCSKEKEIVLKIPQLAPKPKLVVDEVVEWAGVGWDGWGGLEKS